MKELSLLSQISLYVLLGTMGIVCLIIWGWQMRVLKGQAMKNPDNSYDNWHVQKHTTALPSQIFFLPAPPILQGLFLYFFPPAGDSRYWL